MPGTTMESPLKRRRISLTRSFDISPIKVATAASPRGAATRSATRSVTRSATKTATQGNGVTKRTSTTNRRSSDRGRADRIPVNNDDTAAPNSPISDTIVIKPRADPASASDSEQDTTTAALATAAAALSNAARMNGSGPVDEDIYDTRHIGQGRPGSSLRSSARASPRPLGTAKASQQNRGAAPSASPARSVSTANDGGRAASNDSASDAAVTINGKRGGTSGAVSMTIMDQENLLDGNQREQPIGTDDEDQERISGTRTGAEVEAEDGGTFSLPPTVSRELEAVAGGQEEEDHSIEAPEPELPTLPAQLGLEELPAPPQGLLSSSPSGRKLRRMNRPRSTRSRSPNRPEPLANAARQGESTSSNFTIRADAVGGVGAATAATTTAPSIRQEHSRNQSSDAVGQQDRASEERLTTGEDAPEEPRIPAEPSGPIITWDLAVERKQDEYEELVRQRTRLEAEVRLLESAVPGLDEFEVERRGGRPDDHALLQLLLSPQSHDHTVGGSNKPSSAEKRRNNSPKHASDLIAAFLPFTIAKGRNDADDRSTIDQQPLSSTSTPPLPSSTHLSRELLSHFTPLTISSAGPRIQASTIPSSSPSQHELGSLQQEHSFTLTSPDKQLRVELELVTAPVTGKLVSLVVPSMSAWAEPELRNRFCREVVTSLSSTITSDLKNSSSNSSGSNFGNIVTLATGVARYWELATVRVSTWRRIMAQHAALIVADDLASSSATRQREQTATSRAAQSGATSQHHALGRRHLHLGRDDVHLHLFWDIRLDPRTGEASSELDAHIDCPVANSAQRDRSRGKGGDGERGGGGGAEGPLDGVGELFHLLIRRGGVSQAVKGIADVVFGDAAGGEESSSGGEDAEEGDDGKDVTSDEEGEDEEEERSNDDAAAGSKEARRGGAAARRRGESEQARQAPRAEDGATATKNNSNHDDNDNEDNEESSSMDTSED